MLQARISISRRRISYWFRHSLTGWTLPAALYFAVALVLSLDASLLLVSQAFDFEFHDIARFQILRRLHPQTDTWRRARCNEVAWLKRKELREIVDNFGHSEDHGRSTTALPDFSVYAENHC